ncbi:hypothetical protein [Curvivirga aplysinae]|uniref:hypothetical protein n=1 Tax=Curvivirga aplysinae TaxID=2529852 RepID=UPI0012BC8E8A|nr:hypothetical protein [Curvivirga aplysinae]MTI10178.1 hypothetical protein [Curvivirga aplysinae]
MEFIMENAPVELGWWITVVEIPVIVGLFWMLWNQKVSLDESHKALTDFKLEVAKDYVSISYLKDVENRITGHLLRIEDKLNEGDRQ